MKQSPPPLAAGPGAWTRSKPPLLRFLNACHAEFTSETSGAVADYIPELGKADPAWYGVATSEQSQRLRLCRDGRRVPSGLCERMPELQLTLLENLGHKLLRATQWISAQA